MKKQFTDIDTEESRYPKELYNYDIFKGEFQEEWNTLGIE